MEYYAHYLLWWITMGKWFWRWREEKMMVNAILLILGIVVACTIVYPTAGWFWLLVLTYFVSALMDYGFDTGPHILSGLWYPLVFSWGFHFGALLVFIVSFLSK